jgi:hypothetical protein
LIGNGRAPVVAAEITPVLDSDVLYLRLQSGPPEEVAALVAELARVVEQVSR